MKKRRMEMMTDAERERLLSIAGSKGSQMAQEGSDSIKGGISSAGASIGKAIEKKDDETKTVKTEQAAAVNDSDMFKEDNPFNMQETEAPGIGDSFKEERKRRMRARMFTA